MKRYIFSLQNTFRIIKTQKLNSILILSVLSVSFTCCLFTLAMGSKEAKLENENLEISRSIYFRNLSADKSSVYAFYNALGDYCDIDAYLAVGNTFCTTTVYSASGKKSEAKKIVIASDFLCDKTNFYFDPFAPGKSVLTNGEVFYELDYWNGIDPDAPILNGKKFSPVRLADFKYFNSSELLKNQPLLYLTSDDFIDRANEITDVCVLLTKKPSDSQIEDILNISNNFFSLNDVVLPHSPGGLQVQKSKAFIAVVLLLLSFINIKSAFVFVCQSRRKEFFIYRMYGATKFYICVDILEMILTFSIISFVLSICIYLITYPILKYFGIDYPLNIYTVFLLGVLVTVLSVFSMFSCIKEVKKHETR